ncbi:hypothetical protein LCI18_008737 [Fusarium solani-melongenae]|uniref:Uncharacterized protein n=1 Tax=Fusarium solani subsp. cucurbitae TaxID=2747967 RepID=A0ACD3Z9B6_FUSSC|nr:hypothetical protein LCI18_008737 [Fusarium solani-melongenae]
MNMSTTELLQSHLSEAGIPISVPGSSEFVSLQTSYTGRHDEVRPRVITRPQSAEQVATIIKSCLNLKLDPVVRGGGHDMFGRFSALDAVSIDLRDLNTVTISPDKKTARVGGGATNYQVLDVLSKHELTAPAGSCGTVGFVGWCLGGGFGPYVHSYGLGADQITGARVVQANGELVEADGRLLKGLRGGGGSLAIVVELEVKTWPLCEVQAGMLFFESSDIAGAVTTFFTNYNSLVNMYKEIPSKLYLMPSIWIYPKVGLSLTCGFIWNGSASDESRLWLERVGKLAPLSPNISDVHSTAMNTNALGFAAMVKDMIPAQVLGRCQSADISHFSPEVVDELARIAHAIPRDSSGGVNIHTLRADSPSCRTDTPDSVLPYRKPHVMFEFLGLGDDEASARGAAAWALDARNRISALPDAEGPTYLPLTAPEFVDLETTFGGHLEELRQLKREYDPAGVFKHTLPKLV